MDVVIITVNNRADFYVTMDILKHKGIPFSDISSSGKLQILISAVYAPTVEKSMRLAGFNFTCSESSVQPVLNTNAG